MLRRARSYRVHVLAFAALLTGALSTAPSGGDDETPPNLIQQENRKPGSLDWQLTRVKIDRLEKSTGFRSSLIEGYCSHQSVQAGDTLHIMVSTTPPARFKSEVFRTGYYGGRGARLMTTLGPLQGKAQPVPPSARGASASASGRRRRRSRSRPIGPAAFTWAGSPPCRRRTPTPTGRVTSSSSSATTARPTSCSSAATTPGRPTTAGPTTIRSTPTPRATRARGVT